MLHVKDTRDGYCSTAIEGLLSCKRSPGTLWRGSECLKRCTTLYSKPKSWPQADVDEGLRLMRMSKVSLLESGAQREQKDPVSLIYEAIRDDAQRSGKQSYTWGDLTILIGNKFSVGLPALLPSYLDCAAQALLLCHILRGCLYSAPLCMLCVRNALA